MATLTFHVEHPDVIDHDFIQGMLDRMDMSYHKYKHPTQTVAKGADYIESIRQRTRLYTHGGDYHGTHVEPGNPEWLMDCANFNMCEFMVVGGKNNPKFNSMDSSPGLATNDGKPLHDVN